MKIVIICGGEPPSRELLTKEISANTTIIAVDSGANCLFKYNIIPHYLIGDFDSISSQVLEFFTAKKVVIEKYPKEKDLTDAQLALQKAIALEATEIVFLGSTQGGRCEHFLGALGLLLPCADLHIKACLKDDISTIILLTKAVTISGEKNKQFSLLAYSDIVKNLSIIGSKFEIENYALKLGDARTLSNEFLTGEVQIKFSSGKLLLIT